MSIPQQLRTILAKLGQGLAELAPHLPEGLARDCQGHQRRALQLLDLWLQQGREEMDYAVNLGLLTERFSAREQEYRRLASTMMQTMVRAKLAWAAALERRDPEPPLSANSAFEFLKGAGLLDLEVLEAFEKMLELRRADLLEEDQLEFLQSVILQHLESHGQPRSESLPEDCEEDESFQSPLPSLRENETPQDLEPRHLEMEQVAGLAGVEALFAKYQQFVAD